MNFRALVVGCAIACVATVALAWVIGGVTGRNSWSTALVGLVILLAAAVVGVLAVRRFQAGIQSLSDRSDRVPLVKYDKESGAFTVRNQRSAGPGE
ncbi:hypothetical protein GS504_00990 [Rhodococcus hoagii]|nr:hypothetical protein [Prescottella equi]NKS72183.1 hypothetical protein [Prescottella equi]